MPEQIPQDKDFYLAVLSVITFFLGYFFKWLLERMKIRSSEKLANRETVIKEKELSDALLKEKRDKIEKLIQELNSLQFSFSELKEKKAFSCLEQKIEAFKIDFYLNKPNENTLSRVGKIFFSEITKKNYCDMGLREKNKTDKAELNSSQWTILVVEGFKPDKPHKAERYLNNLNSGKVIDHLKKINSITPDWLNGLPFKYFDNIDNFFETEDVARAYMLAIAEKNNRLEEFLYKGQPYLKEETSRKLADNFRKFNLLVATAAKLINVSTKYFRYFYKLKPPDWLEGMEVKRNLVENAVGVLAITAEVEKEFKNLVYVLEKLLKGEYEETIRKIMP